MKFFSRDVRCDSYFTVAAILAFALVGQPTYANSSVNLSQLDLGFATNFAAFALGGLTTDEFRTSNPQTTVVGTGGVGPNTTTQGEAHFTGKVYYDPTADSSNNWVIDGGTVTMALGSIATQVQNVSAYAASLTPDQTFTGTLGNALTISSIPNGVKVVQIDSLNFTGGSDVLTLSGGVNDFFIINVSGTLVFTHGNSGIALSGGVTPEHVLFNLLANGGDALKTSGNPDLNGTFLVPNARVVLSPGTINGAVFTGVDLVMTSGARINGDTFIIPEPTSFTLVGLAMLLGFGLWPRRRC